MAALGPNVLLLVSARPDYQCCQRLLRADPTWPGYLINAPSAAPWAGLPLDGPPPDVIVCDRPGLAAAPQPQAWDRPPAILWLLQAGETVPNPEGQPHPPYDYLFTTQLDGTRLRLSLHNLWQQRHLQHQLDQCRQLDEIFHQAGVGINQADTAGRYIRANQQFCAMVGYSEAELRQLTYHSLTHPDDLAAQVELERQLFAGEITNTTFEKRFMAKDGRTVWTRVTLSAVYDGQPRPVSDLAIVEDITDRVQLEAQRQATAARLVKSEARLMEAQRMAHLGHWEYDIIADKSLWSQELLRQYGLDETLSGPSFETFTACIHPEDWPGLHQAIQALINEGTPYALRHRIVRPDGTVRHTFCKGQAVVNGQGQVIKIFGVSQDVTEAWEAEQALQASERRYRQLVENLPNGSVQTLDCQGTITFIGGKMLTTLGLDPREVIGRHASEMLEPGAWAQVEPCLRQTLAGHPTQWEMLWWNHYFLFSTAPLYGPNGEDVVGILCIAQDITPLKQIEAALRHSEQKHRALVQALPDLIMHIDREGVYLDFFAASNMTVIGETENLIGRRVQDDGLPYELADLRMAYIRQALATGKLQCYEQTLFNGQMVVTEEVRVIPVGASEVLVIVRDMTERAQLEAQHHQAEQELRDSERRYATLTETAPVGIFRFDAVGNCVYVNPRWCEMTGRTLAMAEDGDWQAMLHPDDRDRLLAGWAKALARRAPYRNEGRHIHTDGTVVWFDLQMMPELGDQGELLGYVGTVSDISDRKQAELDLRRAKEELDHFFTVALDLLCIATTDGHFLRLNPAWEKTLGYSLAELQAQPFWHWVHDEDVERTLAATAQLADQKEVLNFVNRYRHRDGSYRWIEWCSFPYGSLIYAAARDITHRKEAELALQTLNERLEDRVQQRTQELVRSERDLRTIFNNVYDALVILDGDGTILDVNDRALELSGATRGQLLGATIADVSGPEAPLGQIPDQLGQVQAGATLCFEWQNRCFDGSPPLDTEVTLRQVSLWNRTVLLAGVRDIRDRKRAERALREANTDLEQRVATRTAELVEARDAAERANQAKGIFLANMSHELRTPLNAILGFSQLMGRDTSLSPQYLENLQIINRSGEHLLTLINDILEMSKVEAGKLTLHADAFDLLHLLGELVEMLRLKAESKGLTLTLDVDPTVPQYLYADSRKLRQVLLNLLSNAIKFTPMGGVTLRVSVRPTAPPTAAALPPADSPDPPTVWLGVAVADTGMGIAPEEMDLLFQPFVQTASGRLSQEGTGLGLPLTQQFIQLMGGTLEVTSELDVGSTFTFEIPVQVAAIAAASSQTPPTAIALAPHQPTYRLLVVEDHQANRQLLQTLLSHLGFEVQTAANGQAAIAHWQAWQPHLILMDMRMPVMDGAQATREIRDLERCLQPQRPPTPIIGLTAGPLAGDPSKYQRLGFDDCIRKPFQVAHITHTIAQHLNVQYLYAAPEDNPAATAGISRRPITPEALQALPPDWLAQFHRALLQLNQEHMLALIENLPEDQGAIAQTLHRQVYDFDYEPLLSMLQPLYPPSPPT